MKGLNHVSAADIDLQYLL